MNSSEKVVETQENELIDYAIVKEEYELNETSDPVVPIERISGNQEFVKFEITEINSNVDDGNKNYCFICEKSFRIPYRLKKHMFTHSNIRKFRCAHCAKAFKQKLDLTRHLKTHFENPVKCDICNKTMTQKGLKIHVERKHTKKSPEKCEICGKEFSTKPYLKVHVKRIHEGSDKERKPLICPICGKLYKFQHNLNRHVEHHPNLKCNVCFRTFAKKVMLKRHMSIHDTAKPFVCEICNKSFRLVDFLNSHRKIHETGEKNERINCCYCSKIFGKVEGLKSHMKQHHRGLPRNSDSIPQCTLCKVIFKSIGDLKKHANKSHRVEKRFECAICCMKCKFKYLLRRHIEKVHMHLNQPNQRNIMAECPICFKPYLKRNLKNHLRTHNKNDRFSCNLCPESYRTKYGLKRHKIFIHDKSNKNKRIMCFYCKKTFRSKNALRTHMRTIHRGLHHTPTDQPPFKCTICKFTHMTLDGLQKHIRKMHRIDYECALCGKKYITKRFIERHLKEIHLNRNASME